MTYEYKIRFSQQGILIKLETLQKYINNRNA